MSLLTGSRYQAHGKQPFFHSLVFAITAYTGADNAKQVIPTVMVAFAMSSILTGLVFFLLGALK